MKGSLGLDQDLRDDHDYIFNSKFPSVADTFALFRGEGVLPLRGGFDPAPQTYNSFRII